MILRDLSKKYHKIQALRDVSFELTNGCTALLGPNGAGKTTLLNCITGAVKPTSGEVVFQRDGASRCQIGYLPQQFSFFDNLRIFETLEYLALLGGCPKNAVKSEVERVVHLCNLEAFAELKIKELSGGTLRRLGIAQALLGSPEILLLDEPTAGVDIEERAHLKSVLNSLATDETMLISTHLISDIEGLCDRILVLIGGQLVFDGSPRDLAAIALGRVRLTNDDAPEREGGVITGASQADTHGHAQFRYVMPERHESNIEPPTLEDGYIALLHFSKNDAV